MSYSVQSEIPKVLQQLFPQLSEPALKAEIAQVGQVFMYQAGQVVMDYGSYIKMVPLIIKGSVRVTRADQREGREIILYFLQPGETCSMAFNACMIPKKSEIRTETIEDTTIIGIPVDKVSEWVNRYQSWKNFIMSSYDSKMVELVRALDSVAFESMDHRLQKYLLARKKTAKNAVIQTTHQEIANDLNASREAISRLLKKLELAGKVVLKRHQIEILDTLVT